MVPVAPYSALADVALTRDLNSLGQAEFDVLVIGGGITGACIAWDAASRGLRVALVDKADFGGATSANSLKTVHGGLRYLRDGDLRLVRLMAEERRALLRIAPHLVHPMPVVMPTFDHALRPERLALIAATKINDLMSLDRNWGQQPWQAIPGSRILSRSACQQLLPGLDPAHLSGGVVWHDAQVYNTERLTLSFLLSAAAAGAQIANYAGACGLRLAGRRVVGADIRDELSGATHQLRARVVINAAGPWVDEVLSGAGAAAPARRFHASLAVNLVTRQIFRDYAVGLPSEYVELHSNGVNRRHAQVLFIAPWREHSIVGTRHTLDNHEPGEQVVTEHLIGGLLDQVNRAYPPARLRRDEVYLAHAGQLPVAPGDSGQARVRLMRESQVHDHARQDGLQGLITVIGVKYTSARATAERAVDLALQKLRRPARPCRTKQLRLYGGQFGDRDTLLRSIPAEIQRALPSRSLQALCRNHGSQLEGVIRYVEADPDSGRPVSEDSVVLRAEVLHAVHSEMACRLSDVVLRRTELGSAGRPGEQAVEACAEIMAAELNWDARSTQRELDEVWLYYASRLAAGPVRMPA
jgi:glycerol-3-phosphate dehydrogenase